MKTEIVRIIDTVRHQAIQLRFAADTAKLSLCLEAELNHYAHFPHVQALLKIVAAGSFSSQHLLELTHSHDESFILGFFDIPYNSDAWLEAAVLSVIRPPDWLNNICSIVNSHAIPANVECSTVGFKNPLAVAIFSENYKNAVPKPHHKAYYFVDKFVSRFNTFTKPAIKEVLTTNVFDDLLHADNETLQRAAVIWVYLHEHFHRKGFLPIPTYLSEKSTRNAGALEELRVDLLACLALSRENQTNQDVRVAFQFILAERLIRYPLQADPRHNYDARSSIAFFKWLQRQGLIFEKNGHYCLNGGYDRLIKCILSLIVRIHASEYQLCNFLNIEKKASLKNILPKIAGNDNHWSLPDMYTRMENVLPCET